MSDVGESISTALAQVGRERAYRRGVPGLQATVVAIKTFQQQRFARTYADLLQQDRYAGAARFFLGELYGPQDFEERDRQFARVVPALVRLFPEEVVQTVRALAELHEVSESLDTAMANSIAGGSVGALDASAYVLAWNHSGRAPDRARQIQLTLELGVDLDRLTRKPLLRNTLRLMRHPAKAAGLSALQAVLEAGFDSFKAMRGAKQFLEVVENREHALMHSLFAAGTLRLSVERANEVLLPRGDATTT